MRLLRTIPSLIPLLVAAVAVPLAAQANPAPCSNAQTVGCSWDPNRGWVSGGPTASQPTGNSPSPGAAQAAAEAAAAQQARDDQARLDRAQEQHQAAQAIDDAMTGAAGQIALGNKYRTGDGVPKDLARAYDILHTVCIQTENTSGCGELAQVVYEDPFLDVAAQWSTQVDAHLALNWSLRGCLVGDQFACEISRLIENELHVPIGQRHTKP